MIDGAASTIVWQGIPSRGAPLQHQTLSGNTRLGNETLASPPSIPLHATSSSAEPLLPQSSIARAPVLPDLMSSAASHLPSFSLIGRSTSSSSSSAAVRHAVDLEWLRDALEVSTTQRPKPRSMCNHETTARLICVASGCMLEATIRGET